MKQRKINSYTHDLLSIKNNEIPLIGTEAFNFSRLYNATNLVPESFAITTLAFDDFIVANNAADIIVNLLADVEPFVRKSARDVSLQITNFIMTAEIPKGILDSIFQIYTNLTNTSNKSFLQVETSHVIDETFLPKESHDLAYFDINSFEELVGKVRLMWASLFSTEAIEMRTNNYYRGPITVGILVRQMKKFELSGKTYSIPPITKEVNTIEVTANYGISVHSIDIQSYQDSYKVDLETMKIIEKHIIPQEYMVVRSGAKSQTEQKNIKVTISNEWQRRQKVSDEVIITLSKKTQELEQLYGEPLEIQWGIETGELYITDVEIIDKESLTSDISSPSEREFLKTYNMEIVTKDEDDLSETFSNIETEIQKLVAQDNEYLSESKKGDSSPLSDVQDKEQTQLVLPKWSEKYTFASDVYLDISQVNAQNIQVLPMFQGAYLDGTETVITHKTLPEVVFSKQKKLQTWIDSVANQIAVTAANVLQGGFIYQFSNPGLSDFQQLDIPSEYKEFYGDERFIQYPQALVAELLAIQQVRESYSNIPPLHLCFPYIRNASNLEDIKKIVSSQGIRRSKTSKFYAEVALPSFAYDILEVDEGIIDGFIINYDTLLRISVYRAKPRDIDHASIVKLVEEILRLAKKKNLECIIKIHDFSELVMKSLVPLKAHGYIFNSIPSESQMRYLSEQDLVYLSKERTLE